MPKLPLNLAILGINEVDSVIEKYPEVQKWYVLRGIQWAEL